ncbi:hypothetical protein ACFQXA_16100 [Nocardiopsis composta]
MRHPAVARAAVVPVPHPRLGEVGCAFVVPAPGSGASPPRSPPGRSGTCPTTRCPAGWCWPTRCPPTPTARSTRCACAAWPRGPWRGRRGPAG